MKLLTIALASSLIASAASAPDRVKTANGILEGAGPQPSGIREFKGVPFAAPPVGALRWTAPARAADWTGVRPATAFGPRCTQQPLYCDMGFRSNGMGEDCLYLNIWTPAESAAERLPVLVYFFGGGFAAGDGSEPRYDGESMARKGIVAITVNYRLGVFGFLAHPELTKESPHHASGNYALLDQSAAIRWVHDNIAAFGGDPRRITIAGESAGSIAVSAQMASPLSRDLIAGAIGESGSILATLAPVSREQGEEQGMKFMASLDAKDIAAMRAIPADKMLEAAGKRGGPRFGPVVDGYFFTEPPVATFVAGKQAHVPLLAGWNSEESNARAVLGAEAPTRANFEKAVARLYGADAPAVLKAYEPVDDSGILQAATELASDRFIAFGTWKWIDLSGRTGGKPVYRYYYSRPRPRMSPKMGNATAGLAGGIVRDTSGAPAAAPPPPPLGAVHSAEIEYALGNLSGNQAYEWTADDTKVSTMMEQYFANFIKTGNPNGNGLPKWPAANAGKTPEFMHIDVVTRAEADTHADRHAILDKLASAPPTTAR